MKTVIRFFAASVILAMSLNLCACSDVLRQNVAGLLSPDETYEKTSGNSLYRVADSNTLYEDTGDKEIITMYLTVGRGTAADGTDHTWREVNETPLSVFEASGTAPYSCEALLQVGDEIGPLSGKFGYGELSANATVRLRGLGASEQPQKSYRIDIKKSQGDWKEQKVVVLNKHVADPTRFRNKLAYDIMEDIPEMFSSRTWFVHLYVKDKTEGEDGLFEDYGLYTAVEQVNKRYFRNRGLDDSGQIYKAAAFDWLLHDELMPATAQGYDAAAFEKILEIKGDPDHTKLLELLEAVNDESVPISETVHTYFDSDNLYYWMGFHILMGDRDAALSNYYLYSPTGVSKWYFISWDNDGILSNTYERLRSPDYEVGWDHGIFTLLGGRLFERIFRDETCRAELDEAVDDLHDSYLNSSELTERAEKYAEFIESMVYHLPDAAYQRVSRDNYKVLYESIGSEAEENYRLYKDSLSEPWPFHILTPVSSEGRLVLKWEQAYTADGAPPVYNVELSVDPNFTDDILRLDGYSGTEYTTDALPAGQYFLRVAAGDGEGHWQNAYEYYLTETDRTVAGTACFYVMEDGEVRLNEYLDDVNVTVEPYLGETVPGRG